MILVPVTAVALRVNGRRVEISMVLRTSITTLEIRDIILFRSILIIISQSDHRYMVIIFIIHRIKHHYHHHHIKQCSIMVTTTTCPSRHILMRKAMLVLLLVLLNVIRMQYSAHHHRYNNSIIIRNQISIIIILCCINIHIRHVHYYNIRIIVTSMRFRQISTWQSHHTIYIHHWNRSWSASMNNDEKLTIAIIRSPSLPFIQCQHRGWDLKTTRIIIILFIAANLFVLRNNSIEINLLRLIDVVYCHRHNQRQLNRTETKRLATQQIIAKQYIRIIRTFAAGLLRRFVTITTAPKLTLENLPPLVLFSLVIDSVLCHRMILSRTLETTETPPFLR